MSVSIEFLKLCREVSLMRWVGVDSHKDSLYVTELEDGGEHKNYSVSLDPESLEAWKNQLTSDVHLVMEASFNTFRLHDELAPFAGQVVMAHPAQTRGAAALHVKTDKTDSEILAKLLRSGFVHPVWVPNESQRALRYLVAYRSILVKIKAATKNRVRALLSRELIRPPVANLFSSKGRAFLSSIPWKEGHHQLICTSLLNFYDALLSELEEITEALRRSAVASEEGRLLMTIPGVGSLIAAFLLSQIGDIARFPNPQKLCAYAGLAPRVYQSGRTSFTTHISGTGRAILRMALSLAVPNVVRRPGPLARFRKRLLSRRPKGIVHVACSRKLLAIIWHMLRSGRPYRQEEENDNDND